MTTQKIYQLPVEVTNWKFDGATEIAFNWEYEDGSADLLNLYEKGKQQQWDTSHPHRLDPGAVRGQPDGHGRRDHPDLRLAVLGEDDREGDATGCASTCSAIRSASSCTASRAR